MSQLDSLGSMNEASLRGLPQHAPGSIHEASLGSLNRFTSAAYTGALPNSFSLAQQPPGTGSPSTRTSTAPNSFSMAQQPPGTGTGSPGTGTHNGITAKLADSITHRPPLPTVPVLVGSQPSYTGSSSGPGGHGYAGSNSGRGGQGSGRVARDSDASVTLGGAGGRGEEGGWGGSLSNSVTFLTSARTSGTGGLAARWEQETSSTWGGLDMMDRGQTPQDTVDLLHFFKPRASAPEAAVEVEGAAEGGAGAREHQRSDPGLRGQGMQGAGGDGDATDAMDGV